MLSAREIMTEPVICIDPDAPVEDAIELMVRHGISGLPVVASCGALLGMITEYDIIDIINDPDTERNMVYHFMSRDPQVVDADMRLFDLGELFRNRPIRRYPVVEDGRLVGVISRRELIRFVHDVRLAVRDRCEPATA